MNVNCVICSDIIDEVKAIAATSCDHVYHADCQITWVGRSKTCLQCRSRTILNGIQQLHFIFHPNSHSNSSDLENEITRLTSELLTKDLELTFTKQERDSIIDNSSDLENKITRLTSELLAKDLELAASEREKDRLKDYVKNLDEQQRAVSRQQHEIFELSKSFSALDAAFFEFKDSNKTLVNGLQNKITRLTSELFTKDLELVASEQERDRLKNYVKNECEKLQAVSRQQYEISELLKSFSALEARVFELSDINTTLANDLEQIKRVHTIINGTQRDAEDILYEHNDDSNAARQLATYCACLKRELLDSLQYKRTLMDIITQMRSENNLYATETRFYVDALGLSQNEVKETGISSNSTFKPGENLFSEISSTSRKLPLFPPLSAEFNNNKLTMCIDISNDFFKSESNSQTSLKFEPFSPAVKELLKRKAPNIRIELGGQGNFTSSGMIKITKKRLFDVLFLICKT